MKPFLQHRSGTILLIVAGLSGLLASLAVAFLSRVQSDMGEMVVSMRETQARIMLTAACSYIQEASRLGWEPRLRPEGDGVIEHPEAHGWIDVRDGSMGPRLNSLEWADPGDARMELATMQAAGRLRPLMGQGQPKALFPVGEPVRFPMHLLRRPPYAIQARTGYNPISTTQGDPSFGIPYLRHPDPQPAVDNGFDQVRDPTGTQVHGRNWKEWVAGDWTPRVESLGMSWFRILREETGAVFTVTCGAGGTSGFRDWQEVLRADETAMFDRNPGLFASLRATEVLFWYRLEWSPAISCIDHVYYEVDTKAGILRGINCNMNHDDFYGGVMMSPNMGGTIQWVQRLRSPPDHW